MSIPKALNGLNKFLQDRDEMILQAIADEYEIEMKDLIATLQKATGQSKAKSIKLQPRPPKPIGTKAKKNKPSSGYQLYCKEIREKVVQLLIEDEDERTFNDKSGNEVVVNPKEFKNDKPKLEHIGKKCASMWWHSLTEEERGEYNTQAKEAKEAAAAEEEETEEHTESAKRKTKDEQSSGEDDEKEEDEDDEKEEDEDEQSESEEEVKSLPKKGVGRKPNPKTSPIKKNTAKTPVKTGKNTKTSKSPIKKGGKTPVKTPKKIGKK